MNSMFQYKSCRCCSNDKLTPWLSLPDSPVANALFDSPNYDKYPLDLNYCDQCGHLQLAAAPDPDKVFATYRYKSAVSKSFRNHFAALANYAYEKFSLSNTSNVLEIGSNDGYLLLQFKNKGCQVQGVEPSEYLTSEYREHDMPLVNGFFSSSLVSNSGWSSKFDLVCANNVLAHIPNTDDVIKGISNALKEGGVLMVECGHRDAILQGTHLDNVYHEHIDYYSPHSFGTLLSRHGLGVEEVETINSHGLSFRLIARKSTKPSITNFQSEDILQRQEQVRNYIKQRKTKMDSILLGRPFVAYGAAAKAVTSLYMLDLVSTDLFGVYDDNELKQGFYFPGTDIVIESPSKMNKDCLVLVTAWNFYEEIRAKLIERGHKGEIVCMQ